MLIIDKNYLKYNPQIFISKLDTFENDIRKYKTIYLFIDDLQIFYEKYNLLKNHSNVIFVIDKNIKIDKEIEIKHIESDVITTHNFKRKIIRFKFLKDYLEN
jgi:hypothetical protein